MFQILLKPQSKMPKFPKCWTWLVAMLVLQLARMSTAAPVSNSTTTDPQPTTASSISSSTITTPSSSSVAFRPSTISTSPDPSTYSTSTVISSSTSSQVSSEVTSPLPSSTTSITTTTTSTVESTWPDYEAVTSTEATVTEWPPYTDEIRQWPGYWIKLDADHVEAQESSVDYRTEMYHIADLFAPRKQPM